MPGGTQLADAYVQIVPSMSGVQQAIASGFDKPATAAGHASGAKIGGGILKGVAAVGLGAGIVGAIGIAKVGKAAGDGLGQVISKGLDRAVNIQNAQKKLLGLGHSANDVTKIMGNALASVKGTAFGLGDAATVAASAVAAGIKPGKELTAYLKTTADTATIAGASLSDIGAILNKANTGTAVYSDTLNQLSDRGIPVFTLLAQHYGVTQDKFTDMVKHGEVDGATLTKVLHDSIGGAALQSGTTAVGAYANIGAAFGRLGVQLGSGTAVAKAPALFTAIGGAVDQTAVAIKPLTDILNDQLATGFDSLTKYIGAINFDKLGTQLKTVAGNVKLFIAGLSGKGLPPAVFPVSGFVTAGAKIRGILTSTVGAVHDAVGGITKAFSGLKGGKGIDFGALGTGFGTVLSILKPLAPIAVAFAKGLGGIAGSIGGLISAGMPVVAHLLDDISGVLKFMGDNPQLIAPIVVSLLALILGLKTLHDVSNIASGFAAPFRAYAATMQALPALQGLATAAQLLFNAALDANPIGIIIVVIAALVAGLVYFFTQTKVGQQAWAAFTKFLGEAWANVVAYLQGAVANVVKFFQRFGPLILLAVAPVIGLPLLIISHWGAIVAFFQSLGGKVIGFLGGLVSGVVKVGGKVISGLLDGAINGLKALGAWEASILGAVLKALGSAGSWLLNVGGKILGGLLTGAINGLVGLVKWELSIYAAIGGALASAGSWLLTAGGKVLHGLLQGGLNALVGLGKWEASLLAAFTGALKGAGTWLLKIGGQIVDGLTTGIRNGIAGAVSVVKGLINLLPEAARKLLGIASPSKVFATIGRFVTEGLAKGLAGTADQVKTAANRLVDGVTDAFDHLASNRTAAQKRLDALNDRLVASNRKVAQDQAKVDGASTAKQRANAQNTLTNAKAAHAVISGQIKDQKDLLAAIAAAPKGAKQSALVTQLKDDTAAITRLAKARDDLADDLKTAQDKLTDAIKTKTDFADSVQQTIVGLGDVAASFNVVADARKTALDAVGDLNDKLVSLAKDQASTQNDTDDANIALAKTVRELGQTQDLATANAKAMAALDSSSSGYADKLANLQDQASTYADKITDLTNTRNDQAQTLTDQLAKTSDLATQVASAQSDLAKAQADSVKASTPAIISTLQDAITNTHAFQDTLAQLKGEGVDDTTYSQLLAAGVAGGGLQAAKELAAAGPGVVQQVADLQAQLATAGAALGTNTSNTLYQAGVDSAQALVDGIKSKQVDNQAAIGLYTADLLQGAKDLGINVTPQMNAAGKQIVAGLTDGINGSTSALEKAMQDLGAKTVKALKKKLGIKSPSRLVRDEVGQQVGAGYVLGIEDMHADAERAATNLAAIPGAAMQAAGLGDLGVAPAPITQVFKGNMGLTADEVAGVAATKARRALNGVNIPRVSVR